jgi:hypothetical protein
MPAWYYFARPQQLSIHNLCQHSTPPPNYRALLGLGLKFCPIPKYTTSNLTPIKEKFERDIYTKSFLAENNKAIPKLFIRSIWNPPIHLINSSLQRRTGIFLLRLKKLFKKEKIRSNLLPHQRELMRSFRQMKKFIVIQADKNLGPCIIERDQYIKRALKDHLLDHTTYKQLDPTDTFNKLHHIRQSLNNFINTYNKVLPKDDIKFIKRSIEVSDPLPKFYITAKVHKNPWKTRPIVSVSGSLLHGLGRWVDKVLQPIMKDLPSYIQSSYDLKTLLENLPALPKTARIGTCDAVSMYTNIDTVHGISEVRKFIRFSNKANVHQRKAVIEALYLIMNNNIFTFGDTNWIQLDGTAMGVCPSCCYAMIYFAPHEAYIREKYKELYFYKRYIDDVFYIWIPSLGPQADKLRYKEFCAEMNTYGKLRWDFTKLGKTQNFLDITITLLPNGKFTTTLFEKVENPYLYIPSHSSHPPGSLKGLIYGSVYRILRLTTNDEDAKTSINRLYQRLLVRGYDRKLLIAIIDHCHQLIAQKQLTATTKADIANSIILHLNYHPRDPRSRDIQQIFREELLSPSGLCPLYDLLNHNKHKIGINRLIIAYKRPLNLGNILSPRIMKPEDGPLVSSYL